MDSLAQHYAALSTNDQVAQVDDRSPGEQKGFVESLPPAQELEADRGRALNSETFHSDLEERWTPFGLRMTKLVVECMSCRDFSPS